MVYETCGALQQVENKFGKDEVTSSNLVISSILKPQPNGCGFLLFWAYSLSPVKKVMGWAGIPLSKVLKKILVLLPSAFLL